MIYFRHKTNHDNVNKSKKIRGKYKRHSAPPSSNQTKDRFRSPFLTITTTESPTIENGTNGNHSEEYDSPQKVKYYLFLIYILLFFIIRLRNLQKQVDHFEMVQENYVFFV